MFKKISSKILNKKLQSFIPNYKNYIMFNTANTAAKWGQNHFSDWFQSEQYVYTSNENSIGDDIKMYCGHYYRPINFFLRTNGDLLPQFAFLQEMGELSNQDIEESKSHTRQFVKRIEQAVNMCTIPENIIVFRAVTAEAVNCMSACAKEKYGLINHLFEKGFMSTSLLENQLVHLDTVPELFITLIIYIPKNSIGAYTELLSRRNEQEILFPPCCLLKIVHHTFSKIYCQLISQNKSDLLN
jgi:hypothetical protein